MRQDMSGRGVVNILAAEQLILKPMLYSTFLLWLLSELFEKLPEVGDLDVPKLVFFFDEAHLLFDDCPPALQKRVEQVVRLIRSKGVGVYFCSQNPDDAPDVILGQLGNRVQHALRAFTPRDQKAVNAAAQTFAPNPAVGDIAQVITQLGVGEALVSTLQEGGVPLPVERALVGGKYDTPIDRESAFENLTQRTGNTVTTPGAGDAAGKGGAQPAAGSGWGKAISDALLGSGRRQGMIETMAKSAIRSGSSRLGTALVRGVLGSLLKK